jgi:hypothetical protein
MESEPLARNELVEPDSAHGYYQAIKATCQAAYFTASSFSISSSRAWQYSS